MDGEDIHRLDRYDSDRSLSRSQEAELAERSAGAGFDRGVESEEARIAASSARIMERLRSEAFPAIFNNEPLQGLELGIAYGESSRKNVKFFFEVVEDSLNQEDE